MENNSSRKKNQHYVPKFYLRNFSYQKNEKQLGVFNIETGLFCATAKLKSQAKRDFYYGSDEVVENLLAEIEGPLSNCIKKVIDEDIGAFGSTDQELLLLFTVLTSARNPVHIEKISKGMFRAMKDVLLEDTPNLDLDSLLPEMEHEEAVKFGLKNLLEIVGYCNDLHWKVLVNKTSIPFLTSDNPVIKYNQYLEFREWPHGKCGWGVLGIQVFIPICPEKLLMFYDPKVYDFGRLRGKHYEIRKSDEVHQLNLLQFLNCDKIIYFNEAIDRHYLDVILEQSKNYVRANIPFANLEYLYDGNVPFNEFKLPEKKDLIVMGSTECAIKLTISGIKIKPEWRFKPLPNRAVVLRKNRSWL